MTKNVQELYGEIWGKLDAEIIQALDTSLDPRPFDTLYEYVGAFDITPEQTILDIGSRDAKRAIEIATRFGCQVEAVDPIDLHYARARENVQGAGLADRITVTKAAIEELPFADGTIDHIWCRDMLNHVDLERGLAECSRVLNARGNMLIYQTFATDLMEAREAVRIYAAMSIVAQNMSVDYFEAVAQGAGFQILKREAIGSEWQENNIEQGNQTLFNDLLHLSRLQRGQEAFISQLGRACYETTYADCAWGIYQILGKLQPRVYILQKPSTFART